MASFVGDMERYGSKRIEKFLRINIKGYILCPITQFMDVILATFYESIVLPRLQFSLKKAINLKAVS